MSKTYFIYYDPASISSFIHLFVNILILFTKKPSILFADNRNIRLSLKDRTEARLAVGVGISFLVFVIAEIILFAIMDADTYYRQARHLPRRLGMRRPRRRRNNSVRHLLDTPI